MFIKYIDILNFKSYKNRTIFGPLTKYNVVTGANGSGATNLVKALQFVLLEKREETDEANDLTQFGQFVGIDKIKYTLYPSITCSVAIKIDLENGGDTISFERRLFNSTFQYSVNGQVVQEEVYIMEIKKLGYRNESVLEETIDVIMMKNEVELARFIDDISGSGSLKDEYSRKKQAMETAYSDSAVNEFNQIKNLRVAKIKTFCNRLKKIYNELNGHSNDALMEVIWNNPHEPYLGGIRISCCAPNKNLLPMTMLSRSERIDAIISLIFSQNSQSSVFDCCLDSLDNESLASISRYIKQHTNQVILVSSRKFFQREANLLIGLSQTVRFTDWYKTTLRGDRLLKASIPFQYLNTSND